MLCTEISKALVVSELGSVRREEYLKPKIDTYYRLASEPNPVHGLVIEEAERERERERGERPTA